MFLLLLTILVTTSASTCLQHSLQPISAIFFLSVTDGVFRTVFSVGRHPAHLALQCINPEVHPSPPQYSVRHLLLRRRVVVVMPCGALRPLALSTFISAGSDLPPCSLTSELGMVRSTATARARTEGGKLAPSPSHLART